MSHSKIESFYHARREDFECGILLPAYMGLIDVLAHRGEIQIEGKENLMLFDQSCPVIIGANHIGDNDVLAIERVFGLTNDIFHNNKAPRGINTVLYSAYHEHHGKSTYKRWVEGSRATGFNMRGVVQAYRNRVINPPKIGEGSKPVVGDNFRETMTSMFLPKSRSLLFPTGTRSQDGILLPAEESLGWLIYQAAEKNINLQLVPMGIIPQDMSHQKKGFSLRQKMKIKIGKPVSAQELIIAARELAKEYGIVLDDKNRILQSLLSHVFMLHLPLPKEMMGVYSPDSPYFEGVLKGEIKSGMRVTSEGGYEVLLVKPNPDLASELKWVPVKSNKLVVYGVGQLGGMFVETLSKFPVHEVSVAHRNELRAALEKKPDTIILAIPNPIDESLEIIRDYGFSGLRVILPQNGVDASAKAIQFLADRPDIKLYRAAVTTNVSRDEERNLAYNPKKLRMSIASLRGEDDVVIVAVLFEQAGHKVKVFENYKDMEWTKLFANMINFGAIKHFKSPREAFSDPSIFMEEMKAMQDRLRIMHSAGMCLVDLPGFPGKLLDKALSFSLTPNILYFLRSTLAEWIDKQRNGTLPAAARLIQKGLSAPEVRDYLQPWISLGTEYGLRSSLDERLLKEYEENERRKS